MQNDNDDNKNEEQETIKSQGGDVIHPDTTSTLEDKPVPDVSPEVDNKDQMPTLAIPTEPQKPAKKGSKKGLLALIVILVITAAGAAWLLAKPDTSLDKTTQSNQTKDVEQLTIGTVEGPASTYFPDEGLQGMYSTLNRQIYEGLVGFDDNNISPLLAESWTNPDEKTWVFKLKPGVKFHTGKSVTATEVKASLEDLKKFEYWSLFVSTIESIEVISELEIKIITTEPDALLLNRLSLAFVTDLTAAEAAGKNGTGAYQADASATNNETSTTLIAFDDYHSGRPKTRKLVYSVFETDEALVTALKDKKIDIAETLTFPAIKEELTTAGFKNTEYETPGVFGLYMNQQKANTVLKNKDMRLAIAQAMDRQTLVDKVGNKNTPATQVVPKSLPGHDGSISFPAFDIAAAKSSLQKAGYKASTSLEFAYVKDLQLDAPVIIEQLRAAGITVKEKVYTSDDTAMLIDDLKAGKFDLFAAGYSSDFVDARDVLGSLLHSTESSYPIYNNPTYDAILSESDKEFDPVKRTQKLQEANKYIFEELAWIPLRNSVYAAYYGGDLDIVIDFNGGGNLGTYYRKVGRINQ